MSHKNKLPTLLTYRSAEAFRDAGIRYAYLKAGMLICATIGIFVSCFSMWLLVENPFQMGQLEWLFLCTILTAATVGMMLCIRNIEFPHFPSMTMEELEAMRTKMGISHQVFQQTHDSVIQTLN